MVQNIRICFNRENNPDNSLLIVGTLKYVKLNNVLRIYVNLVERIKIFYPPSQTSSSL